MSLQCSCLTQRCINFHMGVFYHEEQPNQPKICKYIVATLKEVFSSCQTLGARLSTSSFEDEYPVGDFDEEQEVFISAVISRTMEKQKQKQKASVLRHSFSWVYSPATKEVFVTEAVTPQKKVEGGDRENDEREEFLSVKSCFSRCSSSPSGSVFYSVKTNLSRCSSLNDLQQQSKHWRRSVIEEFCHCEGWPFGLCRRAVLLPPLPKSPSESWLSRKMKPSTKKP